MNGRNSSSYANKEEKAFHEEIKSRFNNIKVIANKEIVDYRHAVLEIDFLIFVGDKILVVELKSTDASKVKGNQRENSFLFKGNYESIRRSPFHLISDKSRKIHSRLTKKLNESISVLPIVVYGNPITKKEPKLELDADSAKISYTLSKFYQLLEEEQKGALTQKVLRGHNYLSDVLTEIRREIPIEIQIQDSMKNKVKFAFNPQEKCYHLKKVQIEKLVPPLALIFKDEGEHLDKDKLEETLCLLEDNIYEILGKNTIQLDEKNSQMFETLVTSTLKAFSERRINYGVEFALSIYFHDIFKDDFLPYIERKELSQKVLNFVQSENQHLFLYGDTGVGKSRIISELSKSMKKKKIYLFKLLSANTYFIQKLMKHYQEQIVLIADHWNENMVNDFLSFDLETRVKVIFETSDFGILSKIKNNISFIDIPNICTQLTELPDEKIKEIAEFFDTDREEVDNLYGISEGNLRLFTNLLQHKKISDETDINKLALELEIIPDKVCIFYNDWHEELKEKKIISEDRFGNPEWIYTTEIREVEKNFTIDVNDLLKSKSEKVLLEGSVGSGKSFILRQLHHAKNKACCDSRISSEDKFPLFIQLKDLKFNEERDTVFIQYQESIRQIAKNTKKDVFNIKLFTLIIEEYLAQIFRDDKREDHKYFVTSIKSIYEEGMMEVLIDGWDEIESKEIAYYSNFLSFLQTKNIGMTLTCRKDNQSKLSIPDFENFKIFETAPLNKKQIKSMIDFRQQDYTQEEKINLSNIRGIQPLLTNPLYLDVISSSFSSDIPTTKAEILIRRMVKLIGWEVLGREKSQKYRFSELLQLFENNYVTIGNSKISSYNLIYGEYKDNKGENCDLFSLLGKIAYIQKTQKQIDVSYEELISKNPLCEIYAVKKYHPSGTAYPVINDVHSIELLVAKKIINDFNKGELADPLTSEVLSLIYELLIIEPNWKKSELTKEIGNNPEDIIFEYSIKHHIKFLPTVILDRNGGPIGPGIKTVMSRSSMGVPDYYHIVGEMILKKVTDKEIKEEARRKFKLTYIDLIKNVPELTWDTIYDRYSGIDDPQFSVSIPVSKYIPIVQELYPQYLEEENLLNDESIIVLYERHCKECEKCKEDGESYYSNYSFNLRLFPLDSFKNEEENRSQWDIKRRKVLLFLLSALEKSDDRDLQIFSSFALEGISLVFDDILFLLRHYNDEFFLKILISKAYSPLSPWVDQELGCGMPPEEELCTNVAKNVFLEMLEKNHHFDIYCKYFRLILRTQKEFNIVKWLFKELKNKIPSELHDELKMVTLTELIGKNAYYNLKDEALSDEIVNGLISYHKEWVHLLPKYKHFFNLNLPWEKIKVSKEVLNEAVQERKNHYQTEIEEKCNEEAVKKSNRKIKKNFPYGDFLLQNIQKRRQQIQSRLEEDLFIIETVRIKSGLEFNLQDLISNANSTEDVEFILNLQDSGKVKKEEVSSLIEKMRKPNLYIKYHLLLRENIDLLCFIMDFLLLTEINTEEYLNMPDFVLEGIHEREKDYDLMIILKKTISKMENQNIYTNLKKIVEQDNVNLYELMIFLGIEYVYYTSIGRITQENIQEKEVFISKFMNKKAVTTIDKMKKYNVEKLILFSLSPYDIFSNVRQTYIEIIIDVSKSNINHAVQNNFLVALFIWQRFDLLEEIVSIVRDKKVINDILDLCDYLVFKTYDDSPDYKNIKENSEDTTESLRKLIVKCHESFNKTTLEEDEYQDGFWNSLVRLADTLKMQELEQYLKESIHELREFHLGDFLKLIRKHLFRDFVTDIQKIRKRNEENIPPTYERYEYVKNEIKLTLSYLGDKLELEEMSTKIWETDFYEISISPLLEQMSQEQLRNIHQGFKSFLTDKKDAFFMDYPLSKQSIQILEYLIEKGILKDYPLELLIAILIADYGDFSEEEEEKMRIALENNIITSGEIIKQDYDETINHKIWTIIGREEKDFP